MSQEIDQFEGEKAWLKDDSSVYTLYIRDKETTILIYPYLL